MQQGRLRTRISAVRVRRGFTVLVAGVVLAAVTIPTAAVGQDSTSTQTATDAATTTGDVNTSGDVTTSAGGTPEGIAPPPLATPDQSPPASPAEQQESESAYADLSSPESRALLEQKFAEELASLDQEASRELDPSDYRTFFSDTQAVVDVPGTDSPQVLDSVLPLRDPSSDGGVKPIDLGLEQRDSVWEAKNPLVDLSLPADASQQLRLKDEGVGVRVDSPSASQAEAVHSDDDKLFYHDAASDTDLMITPVSLGAEIFSQIRSADAPERLSFDLELPAGDELRSAGDAGLEVVHGDQRVAMVTDPAAVDARGADVPTHLEQTGPSSFDLVTEHRAGDAVYPILVDPAIDSWAWAGSWNFSGWASSSWNPSQTYSTPVATAGCQTGLNWNCWANGLYVQAGPGWQVAPGTGAQWAYTAPGATSYLTYAEFNPIWFSRNNDSGPSPYLFLGVYSPTWPGGPGSTPGAWPDINDVTGQPQYHNPYTNGTGLVGGPLGYAPPPPPSPPTTMAVMGLGNTANRTGTNKLAGARTAGLGGAQVRLSDQDRPSIQAPPAHEIPTEWVDSEDLTLTAAATDASLGVWRTQLILPEPGPGLTQTQTFTKTENCGGGVTTGLCPHSNLDTSVGDQAETDRFTFNTADLFDGYQEIRLRAFDPVGIADDGSIDVAHAVDRVVPIYVDHSAPVFRKVSGELATAAGGELLLPSYDLHVKARDGWAAVPSSGVKSIEILVDGQRAAYREQACPQDSCSMDLDWTLETAGLSPGTHRVQIVATDQLGHRSVHTLPGIKEPTDDVIKAVAYDGNPSSGGKWLRDEWLVINSNITRVKTADETTVATTTPCPGDEQADCDQVLSTTSRSDETPGAPESYTVETGSREEDPQVENPSEVRETVEASLNPNQGTGALAGVLQGWQHAPLGSDGQYKLFEESNTQEVAPADVETGDDQGPFYLTTTHRLWVDNATGMPVREETLENGSVVHQKLWDYASYPAENVPPGTFEMPPRPGTTEFEEVTHHGDEAIASQGQTELAANGPTQMRSAVASVDNSGFVPYFLGGQPEIPLTVSQTGQSGPGYTKSGSSDGASGTTPAEPSYPDLVRGEKPLLYWPLGDDSGTDVGDESGHARTGSYVGSPSLNFPGAISVQADDGAVDLNGSTQFASGYPTRRNLLTNPSVEEGTAGFGAWGTVGSLIQDTSVTATGTPTAKHSQASLRVVSAASNSGVWAGKGSGGWVPVTVGRTYSAAAQLKGGGSGGLSLYICYTNATFNSWVRCDGRTVNASAGWTRAVVNGSDFGAAPVGAAYGMVFALNASSGTQDFSVDAVQFEPNDLASGYFDGSSGSSTWEGAPNASASVQGPFANGTVRTFEGWAKRDTDNTLDMLLGGTSSDAGAPYLTLGGEFGHPASRVLWAPYGNCGSCGTGATWDNAWPGVGRWVHWALVFDEPANTAELFINGQSKGTRSVTAPYGQAPGKLRVGAWGANGGTLYGFDGKLDEVAIYDHALTTEQLLAHKEKGLGAYREGVENRNPALYWRLGEDAGQTAVDFSGNARDGTFTASPGLNTAGALANADDGSVDLNGTSQYVSSDYTSRRNLVANPSIETDASGWGTIGSAASSLSRTTTQSQTGVASLKATAQSPGQGVAYTVNASPGKYYSAAAQLSGGSPQRGINFSLCYLNGSLQTIRCDQTNLNAASGWTRAVNNGSAFGQAPAGTIVVQLRATNADQRQSYDLYIDSAQIEEGSSVGPYFDGSSQGAHWEGVANNSVSTIDGPFVNGKVRTFEGWAYRDTNSTVDALISGSSGSNNPRLRLEAGSQDVTWRTDAGATGSTLVTWPGAWPGNSKWVHWALIFDESANAVSLYINGALVSTQTDNDQYNAAPGNFVAGVQATSANYFDGKLDEIAIYDRALTAAEIAADYQAVQPAPVDQQLCLNSVDSVYFSDPPRDPNLPPQNPEDGPPDPTGDEEYVAANYQDHGFGRQCNPGMEVPQDADLNVLSVPPATPFSQAMADDYIPAAEDAAAGDPDSGVVPVDIAGDSAQAYLIAIDGQSDSAFIPLDSATVIVTGDFNKSTVDDVVEGLMPR